MGEAVVVRVAEWPADEAVAVRLLRNYAAYLGASPPGAAEICLVDFEAELAGVATVWAEPRGALLLAFAAAVPVGCVAMKLRRDRPGAVEMKRLWVEPAGRGRGLGRQLAMAMIDWSRARGMDTVLLDTVPEAMPEAAALYRSLGFSETTRHNDNAVAGLVFFALRLP